MKYYSDYTTQYVQKICDELNEAGILMNRKTNRPFEPENFDTLTTFLQDYIVYHIDIYNYLDEMGLVNTGKCPYTGQRIDETFPKWTYMRSRSVYLSHEGYQIMKKEDDENYEKIMGHPPRPQKKTGGCYIATICYGSDSAPEVIALKEYRDNILAYNWFGRKFIKIYYLLSPSIAKKMKGRDHLNSIVKKIFLDRIIKKIKQD